MNKLEALARRLVLLWGLALGCGEGTSDDPGAPAPSTATPSTMTPPAADPATVYAEVRDDMARLRGLEVVYVETLIVKGAAGAHSCYGLHPCEVNAAIPEVAAEYARQAPRLDRLAAIGLEAAARSYGVPSETDDAPDWSADVAALNALEIVKLGTLLTVTPANNPSCYNLPCAEEIARADAENARRRAVLHALAVEASAARP